MTLLILSQQITLPAFKVRQEKKGPGAVHLTSAQNHKERAKYAGTLQNLFFQARLAEPACLGFAAPYFALHTFTEQLMSSISLCPGGQSFKRKLTAKYENNYLTQPQNQCLNSRHGPVECTLHTLPNLPPDCSLYVGPGGNRRGGNKKL